MDKDNLNLTKNKQVVTVKELEDKIDIEAYHQRKNEDTISLDELLSKITNQKPPANDS
jgi:hypothetical protein